MIHLQKIFSLHREGFQQKIKIGEIIEEGNKKYVLTNILNITRLHSQSSLIKIQVVAQLIGSQSEYRKYEPIFEIENKYPKCKPAGWNPLRKVGDVIENDGICAEIINIETIEYDFVDLVVTYKARLIRPWSQEEMNQAVKEYRLSKFKVVG